MATRYLEVHRRAMTLAGARLLVTRGPDRSRALRIEKELVCVGTGPAADLVLTDDTVSRHHLSLRVRAHDYVISDLDSTNGTFLGGRRVLSAHVEPGDVIELGETRLRLEAVGAATTLPLHASESFGALIGASAEARRLFALLAAVAAEDSPLLLVGETGTGKDLAAQAVHDASPRAGKPFVVVDCRLPLTRLTNEIFAAAGGAFAEAAGGTLYLDEVAELPLDLQARLLAALEPRAGNGVRVIAATRRDLRLAVNRGSFREDLFYRLNVVNVVLPPLRERPDDVPLYAAHFYRQLTGDPESVPPAELLARLVAQDWPGNLRELRNTIEQAVALADLGGDVAVPPAALETYKEAKARATGEFERRYLIPLLQRAGGNVSEAARLAHMDRVNLIKLLRKHRIGRAAAIAVERAPARDVAHGLGTPKT